VAVLAVAIPVAHVVGRLVNRWFRRVPSIPVEIVGDVANGFRWLVFLIAVGIAFSILGLDVAWFALAALVIIVVGGLVLRPQMENLAAGLVLTARPAFTIGDVIEVAHNVGAVVQIGSHSTAIETIEGKRVHLPNAEMLSRTITVYSARDSRRTEFDLKVRSHTDLDEAATVITRALAEAPILVSDPAPDVVASRISDNAVTLTVRVWFPSTMVSDAPAIDAGIRAAYRALEDAGIELDIIDISITQEAAAPADPGREPSTDPDGPDEEGEPPDTNHN